MFGCKKFCGHNLGKTRIFSGTLKRKFSKTRVDQVIRFNIYIILMYVHIMLSQKIIEKRSNIKKRKKVRSHIWPPNNLMFDLL